MGDKQRIAYKVILEQYRKGVDPLRMIIQAIAGTGKPYLIRAIKNTPKIISHPGKATINIGKQERQGMTFTTISQVEDLTGL